MRKNLIAICAVGLTLLALSSFGQAQTPTADSQQIAQTQAAFAAHFPNAPGAPALLNVKRQEYTGATLADLVKPIPTAIYTFKHQQFEGVALSKIGQISKVPFAGTLDWDVFAGVTQKGKPVGGVALVWCKEIAPHIWPMLGPVVQLEQKSPVDFGILFGVMIR